MALKKKEKGIMLESILTNYLGYYVDKSTKAKFDKAFKCANAVD